MPLQKYLNNFDWQFVAPVLASTHTGFETSLGKGVLQISEAAGVLLGTLTGGDWYVLTAYKRSGSVESSIEIVKVLGVNEVAYAVPGECRIRVERGHEGTTPQAYVAGDLISMRLTAGGAGQWVQPGSATKALVGLGNVDNTSDANKPVSTATQTALNLKQNTLAAGTDYVTPSGTETMTGKTLTTVSMRETRVVVAASAINLATGNFFTKTISGATTFTLSGTPSTGAAISFILELTNGGSAAVTWWSGVKWAGGTAPTLTAAGVDILGFYTHDGGTTWRGMLLAKDSK